MPSYMQTKSGSSYKKYHSLLYNMFLSMKLLNYVMCIFEVLVMGINELVRIEEPLVACQYFQ